MMVIFNRQKHSSLVCLILALLLTASVQAETPALAIDNNVHVGEVTMLLGKAYVKPYGKKQIPIQEGTLIHVADQIFTEASGHVHIRFVDKALVSVRPDSRLEIVNYDYNADQPRLSTIKLHLEEGVTRAISGDGATSARERFRLNTPIAAIGVRGTDFVVSASRGSVRALVNEGVIVLAPFSTDCTAATFGPCNTNAVELTGSSLQIIELDGSTMSPRLLPATHEREPGLMREEVQLAVADTEAKAENKTAGTGAYLESVTSIRMTTSVANVANPIATPPIPAPVPEIDFTPDAPIAITQLTERQLVWGRWASGQAEQERITLGYLEAKAGRAIAITGGDYNLFRTEPNGGRVQKGLGPVSFALNSAQAFYHSDSGVVAMSVNGGSLAINFNDNSFATNLKLSHSATGAVDFNAAGRINEAGYFHTRSATERLVGAVSTDGKEAGYFFEKQLANGGIQGLTLWDKN